MQEIITEILERLGFPTKNVEELVTSLEKWELDDLIALTVITSDTEIRGYSIGNLINSLCEVVPAFGQDWRYCSLGSELVARLKGNHNDSH
jgi:hypothetical protein